MPANTITAQRQQQHNYPGWDYPVTYDKIIQQHILFIHYNVLGKGTCTQQTGARHVQIETEIE